MKISSLIFTGPGEARIQSEEISEPGTGEVRVKNSVSGVSSGSEMLIYRGHAPENLPLDEGIRALEGDMSYPLKYGYASVGTVTSLGSGCDSLWMGERVFCFHPHSEQYNVMTDQLIKLPPVMSDEAAIFIANMETAVNLIQDASPLLGERVIIFGQGIVGLLLTAILSKYPLVDLITVDPIAERRKASLLAGAKSSFSPKRWLEVPEESLSRNGVNAADLAFEVSGAPDALNQAISAVGFDGRVVIGSWYGTKPVEVDLGGRFHRDRIQIISSQVSTCLLYTSPSPRDRS